MDIQTNWEMMQLQPESIRPNPYQPRRHMDEAALCELADSIARYGLLQPIAVRKAGGSFYELIAGERRLRAARMAGLTCIPALVKPIADEETAILALVENIQREQLHFLEEAEGYINLSQEHGMTQEQIAAKVGKTQSAVANKMRLMRLPAALRAQLAAEGLTERHARALLRLDDEATQARALDAMVARGMNVSEAESYIEQLLNETPAKPQTVKHSPHIRKLIRDTRLLTNSCRSTVSAFVEAGLAAEYTQTDCGDHIEVRMILPK